MPRVELLERAGEALVAALASGERRRHRLPQLCRELRNMPSAHGEPTAEAGVARPRRERC